MLSLTCDAWYWLLLCCYRYTRLFVNLIAFLLHRPIQPPAEPRLSSRDVTVIIPSLGGNGIEDTISSMLATRPAQILLVTIDAHRRRAQQMIERMGTHKVQVLSIPRPNKRRQMVKAIPLVQTAVTIFADDDVTWPPKLLDWMLAPLEQSEYGGVGTNQALRRTKDQGIWSWAWRFLGAVYLQRRNFDCAACNFMDGGVPCLSGRTVAYRTAIIQDPVFGHSFTNELWGFDKQYQLNADDDNFITRWMVSHGHRIAFQYHREAEVLTELERSSTYLLQCLRWSRSNWRSNITSLCVEKYAWSLQPWTVYAVFLTTFTQWALLWDLGLWLCRPSGSVCYWAFLSLILFSKIVKLCPLFLRDPLFVLATPLSIVFGWLHGLIKLHAAFTLHVTAWGSREGADEYDDERMIRLPGSGKMPTVAMTRLESEQQHLGTD